MGAKKAVRTVSVCRASKCRKRGSCALARLLEQQVEAHGLGGAVEIRLGGCTDLCKHGPTMVVQPDKVWYADLTPEAVGHIATQHLARGEPVRRWIARWKGSSEKNAAKAARKERAAARRTGTRAPRKAAKRHVLPASEAEVPMAGGAPPGSPAPA